jgi:replicative DNA helicase
MSADIEAAVALMRQTNALLESANGDDRAFRPHRTVDGWTFVSAADETIPACWGEGENVLAAEGEPTMIVGPDGVGKTSLGQQYALKRIHGGELLGLPVKPIANDGRLLYIAADRPQQAARSMRRMVKPEDEDMLRDRLIVHKGPLPFDVVKEPPWTLRRFVEDLGASDVVIDSLKDLASELTKDEVGSAVNRAFQECIAEGLELLALHHQRKQQQGQKPPRTLADVYGSRWLTAGMGSVVCLWGEAGDLVVNLRHLKQPGEEVGPFDVLHDHVHGRTTVVERLDLEQLLASSPRGLSVREAALNLMGDLVHEPNRNEIEKARRKLNALVARNRAERRDDDDGTARYYAKTAA